ncbi:MAG: molybdenum cofactor guanylyltransferase [Chloroflexi bacterium]|nr:molybdenum cofactor guanylyltransferase [Chloroflexota bacterium]MDA8187895.1 molybdenum cofactor guanylyltransferase [Dehalococcoidales bacterium]
MTQDAEGTLNAIILAGGKSRRLGTDKTVLELGGKRLTEIVLEAVGGVAREAIVVTNSPHLFEDLPARLVSDVVAGAGPLGGILSGLLVSNRKHNLVVGCDMPFLNVGLLRYLGQLIDDHDVVIPRFNGYFEPLHAVYSRDCIEPIRALLARRDFAIVDFLDQVRVRYVEQDEIDALDPSHLSFFNVNTPEDLERAKAEVERRRHLAAS